jgi:hypothetical protein
MFYIDHLMLIFLHNPYKKMDNRMDHIHTKLYFFCILNNKHQKNQNRPQQLMLLSMMTTTISTATTLMLLLLLLLLRISHVVGVVDYRRPL